MYRFRWNWKDAKQETQKYQFIWNGIQSTCTSRVECKCMQTTKKEHCWSLNGNHDSREYYVSNIAEMHIFYILNKNTITYALQEYICMTIKCSFFIFSFACAQNSIRIIWWCIFFGHKTDEMKSDFLKKITIRILRAENQFWNFISQSIRHEKRLTREKEKQKRQMKQKP